MKRLLPLALLICTSCSSLGAVTAQQVEGTYTRTVTVDIRKGCGGFKGYMETILPSSHYRICIDSTSGNLLFPILEHESDHFWRRMLGLPQPREREVKRGETGLIFLTGKYVGGKR